MIRARATIAALAAEGLSDEPSYRAGQVATLMGALSDAFHARGLEVTLVGGAAIEIWAPGAHMSNDVDIVVTGDTTNSPTFERAWSVMRELGFARTGPGWGLGPLYVHVVGFRVDEPTSTIEHDGAQFEVVAPEVPLADRIVGFRHWEGTTAYGQQAIAMLAAYGDTLDEHWLSARLKREEALDALDSLRELAGSGQAITEEVLAELQARLRARPDPAVARSREDLGPG